MTSSRNFELQAITLKGMTRINDQTHFAHILISGLRRSEDGIEAFKNIEISLAFLSQTHEGQSSLVSCLTPAQKTGYSASHIFVESYEEQTSAQTTIQVSCPEGSVRMGCGGTRQKDYTDKCQEEDCGFIGAGPIEPDDGKTCVAGMDGDGGTHLVGHAYCMARPRAVVPGNSQCGAAPSPTPSPTPVE